MDGTDFIHWDNNSCNSMNTNTSKDFDERVNRQITNEMVKKITEKQYTEYPIPPETKDMVRGWEDKFDELYKGCDIVGSPDENRPHIKDFISSLLEKQRQEIGEKLKLAIADEINIARSEGFPTSRLTSLWMKLSAILALTKE